MKPNASTDTSAATPVRSRGVNVGDKVRMLKPVRETGEDLPQSLLADAGEVLTVRRVPCENNRTYSIGHDGVAGSFVAYDDEIESI